MSSPKPSDPTNSISSFTVSNNNTEVKPVVLAQKTSDKKNKMTMEEMKSKMGTLENQSKLMKETDTENVFVFYICFYQILNVL